MKSSRSKARDRTERIILLALFGVYLIVLCRITVFRAPSSGLHNVNLTPFVTIHRYYRSILIGNKMVGISNILGNLIIFSPLGYMSALLFPKTRRPLRILALAMVCSSAIECGQYIFSSGAADIDDIILNSIGAMAGYLVYILTSRTNKHAILISVLMIAVTCTGLLVGNNRRTTFKRIEASKKLEMPAAFRVSFS